MLGVVALEAFMTTGIALTSHYVVAAGRNPFVWTTVAAGVLNVCGCLILPRHFGLLGLAMAGVLAGLLTNYWWVPLQMYKVNRWLRSHRELERRVRCTN